MKGTFFATVLVCGAILTACSPPAAQATTAAVHSETTAPPAEQGGRLGADITAPTDTQAGSAGIQATSADTQADHEAYHKITAQEAKQMIDQGNVTIVDVRSVQEYADGHIPNSILVPAETIGDTPPEELPDLDAVLLVHCRTGIRSKRASDQLVKLGYKHIYDFGGIVDWPYETVKEN